MKRAIKQIYFLCAQNRCRSQMAEAFAKFYGGDRVIVQSAGLDPSEEIHPLTVEAMREVGVDISQSTCKKINMKFFLDSNVIVKLCEQIVERCPIVPFKIMNVNWDIHDPLANGGSLEEVRKARDEIRDKVIDLLRGMNIPVT